MKSGCEMGRDAYADQRTLIHQDGDVVIFDVGANVGNTVDRYRKLFDRGIIHAFEPDPKTCDGLRQRFQEDGRVHAVQAAVSDVSGTRVFHVNRDPATSSLLERPKSGRRYYNREGVSLADIHIPSVAIDDYCSECGIKQIDILKLDAQGGELMALEGAKEMLANEAVALIYAEVQFIALYEGAPLFHRVCCFLEERNYSLYGIYDLVIAANGQLRFADAIFIHPGVRTEFLDLFEAEPY